MSTPFPSLKPSAREIKLGAFPTKTYRALSGATVKRSFGNRPFGYELQLEFRNIADTITAQILQHYTTNSGGFARFTLPEALFAGMSATLQSYTRNPAGILWEYASPPSVQSVQADISTVQITLVGELN
jgi:hypothetical protein